MWKWKCDFEVEGESVVDIFMVGLILVVIEDFVVLDDEGDDFFGFFSDSDFEGEGEDNEDNEGDDVEDMIFFGELSDEEVLDVELE